MATVKELKEKLDKQGVEYPSDALKADLEKLVKDNSDSKTKTEEKYYGQDRIVEVIGEKKKIGKEDFYLAKLEQTNTKGQVVNTITKHVPASVIDSK